MCKAQTMGALHLPTLAHKLLIDLQKHHASTCRDQPSLAHRRQYACKQSRALTFRNHLSQSLHQQLFSMAMLYHHATVGLP